MTREQKAAASSVRELRTNYERHIEALRDEATRIVTRATEDLRKASETARKRIADDVKRAKSYTEFWEGALEDEELSGYVPDDTDIDDALSSVTGLFEDDSILMNSVNENLATLESDAEGIDAYDESVSEADDNEEDEEE